MCDFAGFLLWVRIASACPTTASLCNTQQRWKLHRLRRHSKHTSSEKPRHGQNHHKPQQQSSTTDHQGLSKTQEGIAAAQGPGTEQVVAVQPVRKVANMHQLSTVLSRCRRNKNRHTQFTRFSTLHEAVTICCASTGGLDHAEHFLRPKLPCHLTAQPPQATLTEHHHSGLRRLPAHGAGVLVLEPVLPALLACAHMDLPAVEEPNILR